MRKTRRGRRRRRRRERDHSNGGVKPRGSSLVVNMNMRHEKREAEEPMFHLS